jgi:hypothetical protein
MQTNSRVSAIKLPTHSQLSSLLRCSFNSYDYEFNFELIRDSDPFELKWVRGGKIRSSKADIQRVVNTCYFITRNLCMKFGESLHQVASKHDRVASYKGNAKTDVGTCLEASLN